MFCCWWCCFVCLFVCCFGVFFYCCCCCLFVVCSLLVGWLFLFCCCCCRLMCFCCRCRCLLFLFVFVRLILWDLGCSPTMLDSVDYMSPVYGLLRESCLWTTTWVLSTMWVLSMDYYVSPVYGLLEYWIHGLVISVLLHIFREPWTRVFISLSEVIYDGVKVVLTRMSWIGFGEEAGGGGGGNPLAQHFVMSA